MNNCNFIGRLANDVKVVEGKEKNFISFSIAVNNGKEAPATFVDCVAFGKTAEVINTYFKKGDFIGVNARYDVRVSEKDGKKFYNSQFIVNEFTFCGGKAGTEEKPVKKGF